MHLRLFCFSLMCLISISISAQKAKTVVGTYEYHAPKNISIEEADRIALERAKIQAIADEFGTVVSQSNFTSVNNRNGQSDIDFFSLGGSEVKGEWIETIGKPEFIRSFSDDGTITVRATVKGRIREIIHARANFQAKVLCNGTDLKFERNDFRPGDAVYTRLPLERIGAFAEYVAVTETAVAKMPAGYAFDVAAAIPLTGLTAWQGLVEVLEARPGQTRLIPGGSGSFGEMAVPIAQAMGLRVLVTGNERSREHFLSMGVERYLDYRRENYWEVLSGVDLVIDTLGTGEFRHELSVLKPGGRLLSLRAAPNGEFARRSGFPWYKRALFTLAGLQYDLAARRQGKEYRFMFVHADGGQLRRITEIVERNHILPAIDPHRFSLDQINDALRLMGEGPIQGKVIIRM